MNINFNFFKKLLIVLLFNSIPSIGYAIDTSRPGPDNIPTEVKIRLYVLDVDEITDAQQSFKANIFIQAEWKDQRLVQSNKTTKYNLNEIWNPNLQILNRQKTFKSLPDIVEVKTDGTVTYRQRIIGSFSQPLDLHNFPMDEQNIQFKVVSVGNSPNDVKLSENSSGIADIFSFPNWYIKGWNLKIVDFKFLPDVPSRVGIIFTITAKRYEHFYIFKFIVPLLLIVFMSWIVFWIDPTDYPTQISVSITSMLTLIAYQYLVGSSLPQVPYLTRLDKLMFLSTALVFASLVEVTVTSVLTKKNNVELARSIDNYCRYIFPALFIIILALPFI
ncbi:MAG: hypothetical protein ACR2NW_03190 [Thermodesulfobacteriota bacterium]